jgi:SulP family sulfate permease
MILLIVLQRINKRAPGALIVMVLAPLVVYALGLNEQGVAVIGALPGGLPPLAHLPLFDRELISTLGAGALAVAAIGLVETAAISKSVATQTRQRLDSNQEFVGQGMANLAAGFFTGYPVAGSFSRTAVNYRADARTPVAAILSCLLVLVAMQFLGPVGAYLPNAALAAVLIISAYRMIDQEEIARILRGGRGDALIMMVTLLGTLFLSLETAVLVGIGLSFVRYILHTSTPKVQSVVPDADFEHFVHRREAPRCPQLGIIEILGDLYFGAVNHVEDYILADMAAHPDQQYLLLRMQNVNNVDFSGIHMLENVVQSYRDIGGDVYLWHVMPGVMERMHDAEFDVYLGPDHFLGEDTAISQMFYHVLDPAICIYECPVRVFKECQNLPKRLDLVNLNLAGATPAEDLPEVDAQALWAALHGRDPAKLPVVVDVREPREFRQGHIMEALSLPLSTFASGTPALPHDRPIVVVCRSSRRSRLAAASLQRNGYEHISLLDGGMLAWEKAGLLEAVDSFADNGELE